MKGEDAEGVGTTAIQTISIAPNVIATFRAATGRKVMRRLVPADGNRAVIGLKKRIHSRTTIGNCNR